jgi:signal transduction histidine kinase/DNA-binding response OmpR family regulator
MKFKDLKISIQLSVGLGLIVGLMLLVGLVAMYQGQRVWAETEGLYEHPLQVRRATGELSMDIMAIYQGMQSIVVAQDQDEISAIRQKIAASEANADRQFAILYDRYLGNKADIDKVHEGFAQWKDIRSETVNMVVAGDVAGAAARIRHEGVGGRKVANLLDLLSKVSDFARQRGGTFYNDAESHNNEMKVMMGILMAIIVLLTMLISYILLRSIRTPLAEFTQAVNLFGSGRLDTRIDYKSMNEMGILANSFNSLAENVQAGIELASKTSRIAGEIVGQEDIGPFCLALLNSLMEETDSQVGAIYLLNSQKTHFELIESVGLAAAIRSFSAVEREGELGAVLASGRMKRLKDIPEDSVFLLRTVSGDIRPKEIVTIPIDSGSGVVAVVSLASVRGYSEKTTRLIEMIQDLITARFNGVLTLQQVREFSQRLDTQNRELEAQKTELQRQADEVLAQNMELEQQKRQLDQANRMKTSFLSNMSHELRTPLNSVIALSGVLSKRLRGAIPDEEYSYLDVIERNGRSLLGLLNDILDLSRVESGAEEVEITSFSVHGMVTEVVKMIEPLIGTKDVTLLNRVPVDLPMVASDALKVRHILQNLIGNAVKFTMDGSVEIAAHRADKCVVITVADTGIGISPEHIPFIFDEFRQAEEGTARRFGGTGLGLSIARKYATLLKGTLTVQSVPGKGSTFTLKLPVDVFSSACARPEDGNFTGRIEMVASPYGAGKKILVVEDSEAAVIQVNDMLASHGYIVSVARNGREALEQIELGLPDAMILDLMMPEVDGFAVLKAIRSVEKTMNIPVLILTAKHVTKEELSFLKSNHIHQLIQKGDVSKVDLLNSVAGMVGLIRASAASSRPVTDTEIPLIKVAPRPTALGKPVILVVEDNPDNMKTIRALLSDVATIIEASDGEAGVAQAQVKMPDMILMDISLPFMDGFTALDQIKKEKFLQHVPVIAVTARAMKGDREQMLAYGFDGYVSKPIDGKVLQDTIRALLTGRD